MKIIFSALAIAIVATSTQAQTPAEAATDAMRAAASAAASAQGAIDAASTLAGDEAAQTVAEQQRQNARAYQIALREICYQELTQDAFRALTTPACGEIFRLHGVE